MSVKASVTVSISPAPTAVRSCSRLSIPGLGFATVPPLP